MRNANVLAPERGMKKKTRLARRSSVIPFAKLFPGTAGDNRDCGESGATGLADPYGDGRHLAASTPTRKESATSSVLITARASAAAQVPRCPRVRRYTLGE